MLFSRPDMEKSSNKDGHVPEAGIGLLAVVFALFFASIFLFYPAWKTSQAEGWKAVPCRVISGELVRGRSSSGRHGTSRTTYKAEIRYSYSFNGREYESDQVCFLHSASNHVERHQDFLKRFPAGSERSCFVDPEFPSEAVLDRGFNGNLWGAGFALLVALFGGIQFVRALKKESW